MGSTKKVFYHLQYPIDKPNRIYGRPSWYGRFCTAEWSRKVGGMARGRFIRPIGEVWVDLTIILPSPKIGDFVWTWYSDYIVTDRVLTLFNEAGFTGFEPRPVNVEKIKRLSPKSRGVVIPPLWELLIKGKGGDAAPESGIYPLYEMEDSGYVQYSSFRNGIIVDEAAWDGSDFFTINGYPKYILISEQVKQLIVDRQLTNCCIVPSHKLEWGSNSRPEDDFSQSRAMAARDLESLLKELAGEKPPLATIHALGHKGDPRAVDALVGKFDHIDPLVWDPAASAVGLIARNKSIPSSIREEIFSRLSSLLGHDNPLIRRGAVVAFAALGGEQAAREVMRTLSDPVPSMRERGVIAIGYLRYLPALEEVRRLTRDRSKDVRETARMVLLDLEAIIRHEEDCGKSGPTRKKPPS